MFSSCGYVVFFQLHLKVTFQLLNYLSIRIVYIFYIVSNQSFVPVGFCLPFVSLSHPDLVWKFVSICFDIRRNVAVGYKSVTSQLSDQILREHSKLEDHFPGLNYFLPSLFVKPSKFFHSMLMRQNTAFISFKLVYRWPRMKILKTSLPCTCVQISSLQFPQC